MYGRVDVPSSDLYEVQPDPNVIIIEAGTPFPIELLAEAAKAAREAAHVHEFTFGAGFCRCIVALTSWDEDNAIEDGEEDY